MVAPKHGLQPTRKRLRGADTEKLILFIEMLLKFIYEFPNNVPTPKKP